MALHWGIASAGLIAHDFVASLLTLPSEEHKVCAVAARSEKDATAFADLFNIPKFYEGYEALANDKEVEIVYIASINTQHLSLAKLMLDNGKHVLCEKPLTMNKSDTQELIDYAKKKKLFLMEGLWSRFFPVYHKLREIINNGTLGNILQVTVNFGYPLEHVERVRAKELGGSAILDLGVYVLQLSQFAFKGLKPATVVSTGHLNRFGTDSSGAAVLMYPGGRMSIVSCNAQVELDNTACIYGTKGMLKIPLFWCPTTIIMPEETLQYPLPPSSAKYNYLHSAGFVYEAQEVRQCIKKGNKPITRVPNCYTRRSLELAELMDKLRASAAVF